MADYSESRLNIFAKAFLSKYQIIEIKSWQIERVITMFNSLNSTGMPLSDADIISARLFPMADDKDAFIEQWQRVNFMADELSQKRVIGIDSVLQQFMYIERTRTKAYRLGDVTTPGVRKYYTYENPGLLNDPKRLCDAFEKILNIWIKVVGYPVVKLLLKFNENFKLFLLPYLYRYDVSDISASKVTPVVECLLRLFAIMEMGAVGYSASIFKTFLFNENFNLVNHDYADAAIVADFDKHIRTCWTEADVMDYDKNILNK